MYTPTARERATKDTLSSRQRSNELPSDTIAAVATAIGQSGIGIIRISGPQALEVAYGVFRSPSGRTPQDFLSHTVHYGTLVERQHGDRIDEVLLTVFRAPRSYTGEDVIEVSCHGGSATVRRALQAILAAGARPADPGEFTKRAFLNGRLDLAQAEAVNDLIRAQTEQSQRLALRQLGGAVSREVSHLTDAILSILSRIEASVDFPDDVEEPDRSILAREMEQISCDLDRLIATSDRGRIYREGITLAIVGRPNVGKSSLLNALLRQARAIVTPVPGTTRDVIEETINIRGIPVVAADTAGVRDSADEVERIGVEMTERAMAAAGIVLIIVDASTGITEEDKSIIRRAGPSALVAINKADLVSDQVAGETRDKLRKEFPSLNAIAISAVTGLGIEQLEDSIAEAALGGKVDSVEAVIVTNLRHKQALTAAKESINNALDTIRRGMEIDLTSVDLVAARLSLGEITGDTASEDLIDRIFEEFCIGK
ncbi:MAG: tRNA uridine-5-carboxymethylaminomethyl(34) synthesis GTPase MnmE [Armatimonadetes bacterium]|nr:tRNA uridine-5-carboxymethylaminomethyl(34) synthesis GTPase MnmE [Armatimonadota bacterium]